MGSRGGIPKNGDTDPDKQIVALRGGTPLMRQRRSSDGAKGSDESAG